MDAGRQEGGLRQPRGDDRRHADQPQMVRHDAGRAAQGHGDDDQDHRRQDAEPVRRACRACLTASGRWPLATAPGDTTARYQPGSPDAGIAGFYLVNTTKLDQRPLWEMPALTVHEAVPGHHMQIALQQELEMPDWRRNTRVLHRLRRRLGPLFGTARASNWGSTTRRRRTWGGWAIEMWRATRLVVDTGIHAKGWTKEQAVAFMKDNTDADRRQYRCGGQPLHLQPRPGARLQDRAS